MLLCPLGSSPSIARSVLGAATIILRKPRKKDYNIPSAFRLIALLDTLEKILESIISERIRYVVEKYKTLLDI